MNTNELHNLPTKQVTMIIENQDQEKVKIVPMCLLISGEYLDIRQALHSLLSLGSMVRVYNFGRDCYGRLDWTQGMVPFSFLDPNSNILLVKIKEQDEKSNASQRLSRQSSSIKSQNSSVKKQRSKQRTIFEVLQIVRQWRQLHQSKVNKVSLQQAAQMLRMPKKSLDDYYYQLKLGEKYGFDFKINLQNKIGVLRMFLKGININKHDKNDKHPKKLKILEEFHELAVRHDGGMRGINGQMEEQLVDYFDQDMEKPISGIQDFEYVNEQDPFLAFDLNFKKKAQGEQFEMFF